MPDADLRRRILIGFRRGMTRRQIRDATGASVSYVDKIARSLGTPSRTDPWRYTEKRKESSDGKTR